MLIWALAGQPVVINPNILLYVMSILFKKDKLLWITKGRGLNALLIGNKKTAEAGF